MRIEIAFRPAGFGLVVALLLLAGCRRGPDRTAVSGRVTFLGRPVSGALITFRPAPGVSGPPASTPIVAGGYQFGSHNGPTVGRYEVLVRITDAAEKRAGPTRAVPSAPGDDPPMGAAWLIEDVEIAPGSMVRDFDLDPAQMNKEPRASRG